MTKGPSFFLEWLRYKFSIGSKKRYAGATEEEGYFRYETFKFDQPKTKSSDDLDTCTNSQNKISEDEPEEKLLKVGHHETKKNFMKRNSDSLKYRSERMNSKKRDQKNRITVIPALEHSPEEKFNTTPRDSTLRKSKNRLRFSFVGTLRKRFHRISSSNNDSLSSGIQEPTSEESRRDDVSATHRRSVRIMSSPSLKGYTSKSKAEEKENSSFGTRNSDTSENSIKQSYNNFVDTNPLESSNTSKLGNVHHQHDSIKTSPIATHNISRTSLAKESSLINNSISLVKVNHFFPSNSLVNAEPVIQKPFDPFIQSNINEYVKFDVRRDHPIGKIPQSPSHRNSDPYVNLHFHKFNLNFGSHESLNDDNNYLKCDDLIPAIPPKTYKKDFSNFNFSQGTRSYQSFSSFNNLAISNRNTNKTIQQLPKSIASKCEAFCKRVDALSTDYLPMNMHPLSNKISRE